MKRYLGQLGGQLGVGLCLVGFLLVFLGWNGAASRNFLPAQFPYLISGGIAGLCFVLVGVGMLVVQNQRADRAALQATLSQLIEAVETAARAAGPSSNGHGTGDRRGDDDTIVAGAASYHRSGCRVAEGRDAPEISVEEAAERGLTPCRICKPPAPPEPRASVFAPEAEPDGEAVDAERPAQTARRRRQLKARD